MTNKPASKLHLAAAFFAIYVVWGSSYLAIRIALEGFPPFLLAAVRFSLAGAILFLISRSLGAPAPTGREWKASARLGILLFVGSYGALFWSEKLVSSSLAAVLYATMQLWVVALEIFWYRSRTLDRKTCIGSLVGIAGVTLISFHGSASQLSSPIGIALVLLAALLWAIGALWTPRLPLPESKTMSASTQMLTGGILLFSPRCSAENSATSTPPRSPSAPSPPSRISSSSPPSSPSPATSGCSSASPSTRSQVIATSIRSSPSSSGTP